MFTVCQELKSNTNYEKYFDSITNVDTHMTKNVEWGAVSYLAHSKYGLNGQGIIRNSYNGYKTGIAANDEANKYDTQNGIKASTTNNIYGVYDMGGGAGEYIAGCYTGKTSLITSNTDTTFISKYIDVYSDYSVSKYGDAVYEISNSTSGYNSWFNQHSNYISSSIVVLVRGGAYYGGNASGLFSFGRDLGGAVSGYSFRPVCIVN